MTIRFSAVAAALAAALLASSCATPGGAASTPGAAATLAPTRGNSVQGTVRFASMADHLMVDVQVSGLKPNAEHGFHVHEKGDCSSGDGESAGGHFNPTAQPHGPQAAAHHAGDIPNLKADAAGNAVAHFALTGVSLDASPTSVIGRSVIVHAGPDDYRSQPSGNSGPRLACGVIAGSV